MEFPGRERELIYRVGGKLEQCKGANELSGMCTAQEAMRCSRKGRVVEEMGEACAIIAEMEGGHLRYAYVNSVLKYWRIAETCSGE